MKRAVVLHGTDGDPSHNWQPWIGSTLRSEGYKVLQPTLPNNHVPNRETYNNFLFSQGWDFQDNILVGHSSGTSAILNLLADDRCPPVKAAVLVATFLEAPAGWAEEKGFERHQFDRLFPGEGFDLDQISKNCKNFYFFHGDNDEYCPIELAQQMCEQLHGQFFVIKNGGHLGGTSGFTEIPEIISALKADKIL